MAAFPISIDVDRFEELATTPREHGARRSGCAAAMRGWAQLGLGVDRVDYTKGIPERLRALRQMWAAAPRDARAFTFLLVATPSRSEIPAYRGLEEEMVRTVIEINAQFRTPGWTPIVLVHENVSAECWPVSIAPPISASSRRCRTG